MIAHLLEYVYVMRTSPLNALLLWTLAVSVRGTTCRDGFVECPTGTPSVGICVPLVNPWCNLQPYLNPYAVLSDRIHDLLGRLTLEQKVNMMQTTPVNNSAVPALGIDEVTTGECLHGYCSRSPSTLFPQSITLAAAFNPNLLEAVATAIGVEGRAWRNNWTAIGNASVQPPSLTCFSPQINIVCQLIVLSGCASPHALPSCRSVIRAGAAVRKRMGNAHSLLQVLPTRMCMVCKAGPPLGNRGATSLPLRRRSTLSPTRDRRALGRTPRQRSSCLGVTRYDSPASMTEVVSYVSLALGGYL